MPGYTTAKAAVHGLTRSMARDLGGHRIRVNTVVPGWVMTKRQKGLWVTPEALEKNLTQQCLPDPIAPVYVARMVLFLASDDAAMCTASNFMVEARGYLGGHRQTTGPNRACAWNSSFRQIPRGDFTPLERRGAAPQPAKIAMRRMLSN